MGFNFTFQTSPFPWLFFSGLFLGAALSRATRFARGVSDPERAKTIKWIFFSLYLSLSLVAGLGAVFIPGPEKIEDIRHAYFFSGCAVVFFLVFRFKKSLGILSLFLLLSLVMAVLLFIQSLIAFTGETEIAQIRVIAVQKEIQDSQQDQMKLEIIPSTGESVITLMSGTYFAPVVRVVIFEDYFVFLGAKTWYRFEGITSFRIEKRGSKSVIRQQDSDYYFPYPLGISERLWSFFELYETKIPGVRSVQIEIDLKRARELSTYSIRVQNDGGVQIIEIS